MILLTMLSITFIIITVLKDRKDYFDYHGKR